MGMVAVISRTADQ